MPNKENIVITKENDGDAFNFFEESSDDSEIDVSRKHKQPKRRIPQRSRNNAPTTTTPRYQHEPVAPQQIAPQPVTNLNDNMFEVFTNPDKTRVEESEDEYPPMAPDTEPASWHHDQADFSGSDQGGGGMDDDDYEQPSAGFNTVEEEKQDLLYKFYRLTSKGIPVSRKFNMQSDIREMRNEFSRIQRDNDVKSSIRFSRRMLMACVTGIEFMNKRYDPFDVKLEGWSESVMENMEDYDNVFERLHDKYASKVSMAPEIELLLSLAGSAFMFHLTNSMFNALPNLKDIAKQNPDVLKNMMQSMTATMNATAPQQQQQQQQQAPLPTQQHQDTGEREMKPPAMDMSNLFNMMQPMLNGNNSVVAPVGNASFPIHSRTTDIHKPPPPPPTTTPVPPPPPPPIDRALSVSSISSLSVQSGRFGEPDKPKIISFSESNTTTIGGSKRKGRGKNKIVSTNDNTMSI